VVGNNPIKQSDYLRKLEEILLKKQHLISQILNELNESKKIKNCLKDLAELTLENIFDDNTKIPIRIGIWGVSGAGKSTYITILHRCLEKNDSDFKVIQRNEEAEQFIKENEKTLEQGIPLEGTRPEIEDIKVLSFTIKQLSTLKEKTFKLDFVDAAGGWYEEIAEGVSNGQIRSSENQEELSEAMNITDYLAQCDGIIFLLNPKRKIEETETHQYLIPRVLRSLQKYHLENSNSKSLMLDKRNRLKQFMAFCITKIDKEEYWDKRDDPETLVKELLGGAISRLDTYCYFDENKDNQENIQINRCKFFALASIGRHQDNNQKWIESTGITRQNFESNNTGVYSQDYWDKDTSTIETNKELNTCDNSQIFAWASGDKSVSSDENEIGNSSLTISTIRPGFNYEHVNVLAPVEWLIKSINSNSSILEKHQNTEL
jgi:hypothetical protein